MDLDLVFLGTSGSVPTARRGPSAMLLRRGGERILFDCGEGTQRQLLRSTVGLAELPEVFLTHYHADHYLGLPGMLKTFALRGRELPLTVYGPPGLVDLFEALKRVFGKLTYPLQLRELAAGDVLERDGYRIVVFRVHHGVVANGYALAEDARPGRFELQTARALGVPEGPLYGLLQKGQSVVLADGRSVEPAQVLGPPRPGRKVVIAGDTRPTRSVAEVASEADVLVHDATFSNEERERADETGHATAAGAAELARTARVKLLVLVHLSNRYFGPELAREARAVFSEAVVPRDFDIIDVRFPERGGPRLVKGGALEVADGEAERVARMVQVAVANDLTEAEEIRTILESAGIASEFESAVEHHPRSLDDGPQKVLVPEASLEAAQHAIEAMTDPDELIGGR
jgi:ribonuclease Z